MSLLRLLFASVHGYIDPSSGAATATRDLMEVLAGHGVDCRVLSTGVFDYERETSLEGVLSTLGVPFCWATAERSAGDGVAVLDLVLRGVRVTLMPTASSRPDRSPNLDESLAFLDLAEQVFARFQPQVLLTYGGHPANLELMRRARLRGIAVVFHLHNFAYTVRRAFADVSVVLVPTQYSRRYYAQRLGQECTAIDLVSHHGRVLATDPEPRYLTFVNPVPAKGVAVFARIALELGRRRPDIPLLVVEGRGTADWLTKLGLDLSSLSNLSRMANTPDPRDFWRVTRAVLVPSLWRENAALVAREGLINGLPVLASDRGGLPETLGDAGFLFTVSDKCTPENGAVPTAREVAPWVATVERLWDDPAWEAVQRARAAEMARRWDPDVLATRYLEFFAMLSR